MNTDHREKLIKTLSEIPDPLMSVFATFEADIAEARKLELRERLDKLRAFAAIVGIVQEQVEDECAAKADELGVTELPPAFQMILERLSWIRDTVEVELRDAGIPLGDSTGHVLRLRGHRPRHG